MDHGQFQREGRVMSQANVDTVDLCDNLPNSQAQTQNLNETNALTERQGLPLSQNEGKTCDVIKKTPLNNNGKVEEKLEEERGNKDTPEKCRNEYEEEDTDEMMREEDEEEEDESGESICLTRGKSPDTPMTDSPYSETGSLLETPYPLSPVASPEPTSPVIPVVNPEAASLIDSPGLSNSDTEVEPAFTMGPVNVTTQSITSDRSPTTEASDGIAKSSSTEQNTSSTEPVFYHGPVSTAGPTTASMGPVVSAAETFTLTALTELNTTTASLPASAATETLHFATGPNPADPESRSTTLAVLSNQEQVASTPLTAGVSVSTFTAGSVSGPALLEALEQLAQGGDDTHLPLYLHQIAEAFFLQGDYQQALWFIQLERLYHQRVLNNLNALQEQWESQCRVTCSSDLATHYLDTLKHICQTHSRPRTRDAEYASLDLLRLKSEGHGAWPSCNSDHQVEGRMEQKAEDSLCPVIPSNTLPETYSSPEISEKDREDPARESERRGIFYGSPGTAKESKVGEGGEAGGGGVGCTISVIGNGLHPSPAGAMDQSKSAEQQGDLCQALEEEQKEEEDESEVEEAAEALEMEDEGAEDEGEEKQKEGDPHFCQEPLPVETLVSGAEVEPQQPNQDALGQEKQHDESRHCQNTQSSKASLHGEVPPPQEAHIKQQEECAEEKEVDEEEDYDVYQADIIREAPSLDDMAKLITVEEISPASGLVSILKKRNALVDSVSVPSRTELQPERQTPKRRVRFKVPDDSYDNEVGSGDSCLLLFLLCLVTVIISVGGTALYCALGDAQSSVCQDFSRNADFYFDQIHRGIAQIQHWFASGS
ncbi:consortin [Xenentodon cancila]